MTERAIVFPDNLDPKWIDRFVSDVQAHVRGLHEEKDTYPSPYHGWICFHCGERFTTQAGAAIHFGTPNDRRPICTAVGESAPPR